MKRSTFKMFLAIAMLFCSTGAISQTVYRSIASGAWGTFTTWERSTNGGGTYSPAISGQLPTTNNSVIIQSPHIVNLEVSGKSCVNLTINSGAQLTANGNAFSLRVGAGSSGTAGITGFLTNNGVLGAVTGDGLVLELPAPCDTMTVLGTGVTNIGRIRNITTNSNNPGSVTAGHTNDARLYVDQNMILTTSGNYCFSMPNSTVATTDVMYYTINAGRTVSITAPTGKWENTLMSSGGAINGGAYTYNIDGTLDLSATTATSAFVPYANASSAINVNIAGTVKLGTAFKADTVDGSFGAIALNITNGGLLDASLTTSFNVGKTGTSANTTNGNIFWVLSGTGAIRRTVTNDGAKINYPIGTSISSYTPISISRDATAGVPAVYTIGIQNTFSKPVPDANKVVNRQFNTVVSTAAGTTLDTFRISWTTAEQAPGFDPAQPVWILKWSTILSNWQSRPASVTGTGTTADPYVAKAWGFLLAAPAIQSEMAVSGADVIPVTLINFNASYNGQQVNLKWKTTNEINSKNFVIERSNDGRNFNALGTVNATNGSGENNYAFADASPLTGASFYRLKIVDIDGKFKYSNIVSINTKLKGLTIYPNPVTTDITVSHSKATADATIKIYSADGRVVVSEQPSKDAVQSSMNVAKLAPGVYQLQYSNNNERSTIRFVKQ